MAIFRLNVEDDNLHNAELVIAKKTDIELEKHLESWLENSPGALVEGEPILWIGRQTSANVEESTIFPDLPRPRFRGKPCHRRTEAEQGSKGRCRATT